MNIIVAIIAGIKGNELAWQSGRFSSVEDCIACQKIWAKWAWGLLIVSFALWALMFMIGLLGAAASAGAGS